MILLNYKQQETQPTWFNENANHFYHAVTSGSSPFNEWYEFATEDDALEFALTFESQSVIDNYIRATGPSGKDRWYCPILLDCRLDKDGKWVVPERATPASFADLAQAESRF